MNEELVIDTEVEEMDVDSTEDADQIVGAYPELAHKYKAGEELTDQDLDQIADVSITVLRNILEQFDAEGAPIDEYEGDEGELILDVTAPDLAVLIGRHGRTLESLQTMVSLIVSRKLGFRYPVVVDIEGYKSRRNEKVASMARSAAARAVKQHTTVKLPPMSGALFTLHFVITRLSKLIPKVLILSVVSSSRWYSNLTRMRLRRVQQCCTLLL